MLREKILQLTVLVLVASCGQQGAPKDKSSLLGPGGSTAQQFRAEDHTPGYFRDTFRLLDALSALDDATAASRLRTELGARVLSTAELPEMLEDQLATIEGLVILAYRSVLAAADAPEVARQLGESLLQLSLGLDPAVSAYNAAHPASTVQSVSPGAQTLAGAGLSALGIAGAGAPELCVKTSFATASTFDAGEAETVWINERCEPDRYVGDYCEPDEYMQGDCRDEWIPEDCIGGNWEDQGYYEYYCYDSDDCRYEWREYWVYADGTCTGGYYEEYCEQGYWEYGLCYEGTFVAGYCTPGHYEYRFPSGVWTFEQYATAPTECSSVRPEQYAIALSAVGVLVAKAYEQLEPEWRAAADRLLAETDATDEARYDAAQQILRSAIGG